MSTRILLAALALLLATVASADVIIRDHADQAIVRYDHSYALLIGVSDYTAGWRDLKSIPGELDLVEAVLVEHGFEITKVLDPTEGALRDAFEAFIDAHGYVASHRLLVYFAGHGYSRQVADNIRGYLVPADAPRPTEDLAGFLGKAVPMSDIANWARRIEALHALFVFDSCFSGTVFDARSELPQPSAVSAKMAKRVRQFLTAGSADEEVPGTSQFTPAFVEALRGAADLVPDGYVTGTELGVYLDQKARLPRQTPQFGRLAGYHQGDFVFRLNKSSAPPPAPDGGFDLGDLRDRSQREAAWAAYQSRMETAFGDVVEIEEALGGSPTTKVEAWRRFLDAFAEDNPHSENDERLRQQANERLRRLGGGEPLQRAEPAKPELKAGDVWVEPTTGMRFRYIPAGTFQMGSADSESGRQRDEAQREVTLTKGYWIGETEVTQAQWLELMDRNPSNFHGCGVSCPVERVNWFEAVAFANALSETTGRTACYRVSGGNGNVPGDDLEYASVEEVAGCTGFRLPTEAEWEYAARAGSTGPAYSRDLDTIAWYEQKGGETTHAVGKKAANAWGLHDMLGNAYEWCSDRYGQYDTRSTVDPSGPDDGANRVLRGGSWYDAKQHVRAAARSETYPGNRYRYYGFRLASSGPILVDAEP